MKFIASLRLQMASFWEPTSCAVLTTDAVVVPTTDLSSVTPQWKQYMTINAILSMFTSIPFGTRRGFDNPSHCRDLFLREIIVMRVLTFSKKTL